MKMQLNQIWHKTQEFIELDESIGKLWHKILNKREKPNQNAQVLFVDIKKELRLMYHLMGGIQTKTLYATDKVLNLSFRSLVQKLTGDEERFIICWQDSRGVYLPEEVSLFSDIKLNKMYYIWMVAMTAYANVSESNWSDENHRTQRYLLKHYPGFRKYFDAMLSELIEDRKKYVQKYMLSMDKEDNFYTLLTYEGKSEIDIKSKDVYPFPLWLYPSPIVQKSEENFEYEDDEENSESNTQKESESLDVRKNANRINDESETDGLMMFLPEGLMTISERINVDRSEDDSEDEDAAFNAKDLDELTLGKKKKGLASRLKIDLELPTEEVDTYAVGDGILLDEWDYTKEAYLYNYCLLTPIYRKATQEKELDHEIQRLSNRVKSEFASYVFNRVKESNLVYGEELNLDHWIAYIAGGKQSGHKQNFFENIVKKERDLSTLILADISLSTEAAITTESNILDIIKKSLFIFAEALDTLGDPLSLYAFSSVSNKKIRYHVLKNFNEAYSAEIRGRIDDLRAGYYTRLGTAIRQSTRILEQEPTANKLMLIISDGKPNDVDRYEGRYGVEDTKKAIVEAKKVGVRPFCITVDSEANSYLPQIFGKDGYTYIRDIRKLPLALPEIYMNITE